ncbi:MAG: phosphate ABC transporter substrate-binding protein [Synergistaceae bacterium]|jgi:phosphate transport system substrate-binding protein|nr:phosphate ABC transporter substrate-binding protein [Synergistaceae bacterium]
MRKSFAVLFFAAAVAVAGLGSAAGAASEIAINGSTTVLPFAQSTAEAFMKLRPDVRISVSGGGSGNGAKSLIDGMVQIASMSRAMKDSEINDAKKKGIDPVRHTVAVDCIVPIVHPSNPVNNLTVSQIRDIYAGSITNWKDVGGPDKRIAVVGRDTSSGTYEVWEEKVMKGTPVTPRALIVASSGALVQTVAGNPLSIGYDSLGYVDPKLVKALGIDGVKGTPDTARDGTIATSRLLYMYTNGAPAGDVKAYLDFLTSDDGQRYVAREGFVTLK